MNEWMNEWNVYSLKQLNTFMNENTKWIELLSGRRSQTTEEAYLKANWIVSQTITQSWSIITKTIHSPIYWGTTRKLSTLWFIGWFLTGLCLYIVVWQSSILPPCCWGIFLSILQSSGLLCLNCILPRVLALTFNLVSLQDQLLLLCHLSFLNLSSASGHNRMGKKLELKN